jgi:hypothetical protein
MALVDRAKNMIVSPATEWPVVAMEPATPATIFTGYVIPLAAIGPVCAFLMMTLFQHHLILGAVIAVISFVLELVFTFIIGLIASALAPNFGGVADRIEGLKLVAYGYTARWVAGIFQLIPILGSLLVLLASLYSLYVVYIGVVPAMKVPQDKAVTYALVLLACVIVLGIVVGIVVGIVTTAMLFSTAAATGAFTH